MSNSITRLSLNDLKTDRDRFCQELYLGLREYGFVILRDHGIDKSRLDQAYGYAKQLFELPKHIKLKYDSGSGGKRGYTAFGRENAKATRVPSAVRASTFTSPRRAGRSGLARLAFHPSACSSGGCHAAVSQCKKL